MATSERLAERGAVRGRRLKAEAAAELRGARLSSGLSQDAVARAIGVSRSTYGRIERGVAPDVGCVTLARAAAILGLDLTLRFFPAGPRLRDAGHLRVLRRLRERLGPGWRWRYEVPLPALGDQRAWDAVATHTDLTVAFDVETVIHDMQALIRRELLKSRDAGSPRVVLVAADTDRNRAAVGAAGTIVDEVLPVSPRRTLAALAAGLDPGGNAMVFV